MSRRSAGSPRWPNAGRCVLTVGSACRLLDESRSSLHVSTMVRLTIDFWGLDIKAELDWLESYLEILKAHLSELHDHPPDSVLVELNDPDPDVHDSGWQVWHHVHSEIAPRLSRGAFIVMLYAAYEAAVVGLAKDMALRRLGTRLELSDIAGSTFLDRARKYFDHVLGITLCPRDGEWSTIGELARVRHLFAHANGRLQNLNKRSENMLRTLEERGDAAQSAGSLIILAPYAHRALGAVDASLRSLIERTKMPRLAAGTTPPST